MKAADLSQDAIQDMSRLLGLNGPYNSQMSLLQNGRLDPKAKFFFYLAKVNHFIDLCTKHQYKKQTGPQIDAAFQDMVVDRAAAAHPYLNDKGEPANGADFLLMFFGEAPLDSRYTAPPPLSTRETELRKKELSELIKLIKREEVLTAKEILALLVRTQILEVQQCNALRDVIIGDAEYNDEFHHQVGATAIEGLKQIAQGNH